VDVDDRRVEGLNDVERSHERCSNEAISEVAQGKARSFASFEQIGLRVLTCEMPCASFTELSGVQRRRERQDGNMPARGRGMAHGTAPNTGITMPEICQKITIFESPRKGYLSPVRVSVRVTAP